MDVSYLELKWRIVGRCEVVQYRVLFIFVVYTGDESAFELVIE